MFIDLQGQNIPKYFFVGYIQLVHYRGRDSQEHSKSSSATENGNHFLYRIKKIILYEPNANEY